MHCSKDHVKPKKYIDNIYELRVTNNKFKYVIEEDNKYTFHEYKTDEILYAVDSLFSYKIKVNGQNRFVYSDDYDGITIYNHDLEFLEKIDASVDNFTDSTLILFNYVQSKQRKKEREGLYPDYDRIRLYTYPKGRELIAVQRQQSVRINGEYCRTILDTLGVVGIYNSELVKIRDLNAGEYIRDYEIHSSIQLESDIFNFDDFIIDNSKYPYEGFIQMDEMNNELYLLNRSSQNITLTDHKFKEIEKTEFIANASYKIFMIKNNPEIGIKPQGAMDWSLPGRNDSIYAQVEVCDSVFYEQYWSDSDSLNYKIANAENHYDSNVRAKIIDEFSDTYEDNPNKPLFLIEDDGFQLLSNELNVIFESEDALEKYAINSDSILMLLREKFTNKTYLKLYSWKE